MKILYILIFLFTTPINGKVNSSPIKSNLINNSDINDFQNSILLREDKDLLINNIQTRLEILTTKNECVKNSATFVDIEKCIFSYRKANRDLRKDLGQKRS